ncbi:hypothetical protein O3P69_003104 [Scylla paramamosain]|uniref:Ig-like domain-containing protein n=1 Tax=Scylla paramamosain TaxID=85552 RepID=A0AAW0UKJ1_SCYPA
MQRYIGLLQLRQPRQQHQASVRTLVAVTAVRGSTARLPCHITSPNPEEPVLLVLWYKNASVTPVYSDDTLIEFSPTPQHSSHYLPSPLPVPPLPIAGTTHPLSHHHSPTLLPPHHPLSPTPLTSSRPPNTHA